MQLAKENGQRKAREGASFCIKSGRERLYLCENEKAEVAVCHHWGLLFITDYSSLKKEEVHAFFLTYSEQ